MVRWFYFLVEGFTGESAFVKNAALALPFEAAPAELVGGAPRDDSWDEAWPSLAWTAVSSFISTSVSGGTSEAGDSMATFLAWVLVVMLVFFEEPGEVSSVAEATVCYVRGIEASRLLAVETARGPALFPEATPLWLSR